MSANPKALYDLAWDSAECVRIVLGTTRVVFNKFSPPKVEVKTEKVVRVGESRATKRTPGRTEIADMSAEILLTDYSAHIMPRMPRMGGTLVTFPIIAAVKHPSIAGSFNTLLDECRIVSEEGPEMDGSEKALVMKLGISVMQVWHKNADKIWRCLSYETAMPSEAAKALMQF